ncbi:hypothetical protein [Tsuneonella sp. HG222]
MDFDIRQSWLTDLTDLLDRCVGATSEEAPQILRDFHTVCRQGPPRLCADFFGPPMQRAELDRLLECGAIESAALRLKGNRGFMLSGNASAIFIATVMSPGGREAMFDADNEAVAVIGAAISALCLAVQES